jgi:hypothetical protein
MKHFHKLASFATGLAMLATAGFSHVALAQDLGDDYKALGQNAGYGDKGLYEIVGGIIKVALGVVGLIAILLVIFGGFKWMTSGGSEEKVDEAKKILYSGIIGLVIILSAYALSSFVLKTLTTATGTAIGG